MVGGRRGRRASGQFRPRPTGTGPELRDFGQMPCSGELKRLGSELSGDRVSVRFEPFFFDLDAKFHRGLIRAGCG